MVPASRLVTENAVVGFDAAAVTQVEEAAGL